MTGAGQGIGQAIALALAERGALVIAADLKSPHETARKIGPAGYALQLDVTREEDWHSVFNKSLEIGEVDIVAFHLTLTPASIAPALLASMLWVVAFLQYRKNFESILAAKPALKK